MGIGQVGSLIKRHCEICALHYATRRTPPSVLVGSIDFYAQGLGFLYPKILKFEVSGLGSFQVLPCRGYGTL